VPVSRAPVSSSSPPSGLFSYPSARVLVKAGPVARCADASLFFFQTVSSLFFLTVPIDELSSFLSEPFSLSRFPRDGTTRPSSISSSFFLLRAFFRPSTMPAPVDEDGTVFQSR